MQQSTSKSTSHIGLYTLVLCFVAFFGCASSQSIPTLVQQTGFEEQADNLVNSDPLGAIPAPRIPSSVTTKAESLLQNALTKETQNETIFYEVKVEAPEDSGLATAFLSASILEQLKNVPLSSLTSLEQRVRTDVKTATKVLHSFGYYDGEVQAKILQKTNEKKEEKTEKTFVNQSIVSIAFTLGTQYRIGKTTIARHYPKKAKHKTPGLPISLSEVGLAEGDPAIASAILAAVSSAHKQYQDNGYPNATIRTTRYTINKKAHTLDATIELSTGPQKRMGTIIQAGSSKIRAHYLQALQTWEYNQLWNQSLIERYKENLRQSGLFQSATVLPKNKDKNGASYINVNLTPLPERTAGADIKYDSDFGAGFQMRWEHRNLTNNGDKLSIDIPIWKDLQQVAIRYRLPFFLSPSQYFLANAIAVNEKTDAYTMKAGIGSVGIERQLSNNLRGSILLSGEGGSLKDSLEKMTEYYMIGVPLQLWYDTTNSLLDASKGFRLTGQVAPYKGEYRSPFSIIRSKFEGQFFAPLTFLAKEDTLILALRGAYGTMKGASAQNVPVSARFYSGGGGSVRGYSYQSLSPRNSKKDPIGGSSFNEASLELRYKITPEWGIVGFTDGGMAYESATPSLNETRWGAGLGIRYYTAIGPIRFDVAKPLNPRTDDASFQVYFSIGQNF